MSRDPQTLFNEAERAFSEGRFADACAALAEVEPLASHHPAIPHLRAVAERRRGELEQSRRAFERALALAPGDPQIANNFGNLLCDLKEFEAALEEYRRAVRLSPHFGQAGLNAAITLQQLGRLDEARKAFATLEGQLGGTASYWAARGALEREGGNLSQAAECFEAALAIDPAHRRALVGRARVARAEGDPATAALYEKAAAADPGDRGLMIEEAEARAADGEAGAADRLAAAVAEDPSWVQGHDSLARLRWEMGDREIYLQEIERARAAAPQSEALWSCYLRLLADSGDFARAAEAAAEADRACGPEAGFALSEAVYAGLAGDDERAERLFASLPADAPNRAAHEARHRIRRGELDRAEALLEPLRRDVPADIPAWALTELVWRATDHPDSAWLSGAPEFVRVTSLGMSEVEIRALAEFLHSLHRLRARPLGQSLRGGTQTRHRLFDRREPLLARLREALREHVHAYMAALPPRDAAHPLLRHREAALDFAGSWSVRLTGSGHHVSHVHPDGVLSSACYVALPDLDADRQEGWLELGVPPPDLRLPLAPLALAQPVAGGLALFPSYLFHGTRPFGQGDRLTVAFDMAPAAT